MYKTIRIRSEVRSALESARIAHESKTGQRLSLSDYIKYLLGQGKTEERVEKMIQVYDYSALSKHEVELVIGNRIACTSPVVADLQKTAAYAKSIGHKPNNNYVGKNPVTDWITDNIPNRY